MKKHIIETMVNQCHTCPEMDMDSERKIDTIERVWTCSKLNRFICNASLSKDTKKYIKKPIIHKKNWFPNWCPLPESE